MKIKRYVVRVAVADRDAADLTPEIIENAIFDDLNDLNIGEVDAVFVDETEVPEVKDPDAGQSTDPDAWDRVYDAWKPEVQAALMKGRPQSGR